VATGVLLLPEHNPVLAAKQAANPGCPVRGPAHAGSGDRLVGGTSSPHSGCRSPRRAERTAEYIAAMRAAVGRRTFASFDGEFAAFGAVRVNPKPVRDRRIPIVIGGNSDAALRRVAACGDGWYGFNVEIDDVPRPAGYVARAVPPAWPGV